MTVSKTESSFEVTLHRPAKPGPDLFWTFLVLPKTFSETLSRRGRVTVDGTFKGNPFRATLEPDGQLSHWLKVTDELRRAAGVEVGDLVRLEIRQVEEEPEPEIPADFEEALAEVPEAKQRWSDTTNSARLDWIHWIESAKQPKTRAKRIGDACRMLAEGKHRVCCFDPSGFYSKAFRAPEAAKCVSEVDSLLDPTALNFRLSPSQENQ